MTNDISHTDACITSPGGIAHPLYFQSGESRLFAWLHRPDKPIDVKLGVVICSPFGYESICAHRSVREFAETIAAEGIPALRFDYLGAGDSADIDENADLVDVCSKDVAAAIRELRSQTGVDRICLVGIRFGALLATLAAVEDPVAESLILVGPIVSGRRYVRDLRMTQLAGVAMSGGSSDSRPEANPGHPKVLEAGGFALNAATLQSLSQVDLQTTAPKVRSMLILDNDKLPAAKRWGESLTAGGIELDYRNLPGLVEMAMTAPQFAAVPREMVEAIQQWLRTIAARARATSPDPSSHPPRAAQCTPPMPTTLQMPGDARSVQASITERPVFIPGAIPLFGIVTEPPSGEKRHRAVVLLNPGADFHIGASRMYVSLARRWARRGYFVLRLDLAGIGDSPTRAGNINDEVFPEEAVEDIRNAVEFMRSQFAAADLTLAGLCSGAYHALRAAAAGVSVNRLLMVNPQNYFWEKGMTLEQIQLAEAVHNPALYRQRMLSIQAWRRMLTGQVNIVRIAGIYLQRLRLQAEAASRNIARRFHVRLAQDLGWELQNIAARGIRVTFIFARGEPGIELLKLQAGSMVSRLGEDCRVHIIENGDHIFSRKEHRVAMESVLSEELFARARDGARAAPETSPAVPQASHE